MITRLEATRYRCFEHLGVDVGDFRVLVGANGSGKTTLLDLPVLFGDLLRATNVSAPFMERRPELPPRAGNLNELVFAGRGSDFSLAVEACLPDVVQSKVLEGMFARKRTERSRRHCRRIAVIGRPTFVTRLACGLVPIKLCRWFMNTCSCSLNRTGLTAARLVFMVSLLTVRSTGT